MTAALSLESSFFARETPHVARDLLGHVLVREVEGGRRLSGRIVEAEAYMGWDDRASHAHRGQTPRTVHMFGPVGYSYVYFTYGNHWMLNVIAKLPDVDFGAAVLIRALEPLEGLEIMAERRPDRPPLQWTSGPGKLTKALGIDKSLNGIDMTSPGSPLYFERGSPVSDSQVSAGPRIGVNVEEPWGSMPWRFWITGNPYVSR